jgi:hypothetical protein
MARKRVFLDECNSDLRHVFGPREHVYTARDLGVNGREDLRVIDKAVAYKCLIVTVNKDFLDYYRDHPRRKGKKGTFFYGLIFLKPSKLLTRERQLRIALKDIAWEETRKHDDVVRVSATGRTRHERLCHTECAAAFSKEETEWD